jgi:peptide/nickel transport system substrate-binding protein
VFSNREQFEAVGLPVETRWTGPAGPGLSWAADPKTDELGEGAKNFTYDPAEAKKLLQASGVKLPIAVPYNSWPGLETPDRQALVGMLQATGDFQFTINILEITDWITNIDTVHGDFDGISIKNYVETTDWDYTIFLKYHPSSSDFWMGIGGEDPKMTDYVNRQRRELDPEKRIEILKEWQKYDAQQMYYIPNKPASWKPFYVAQPWVGNWGYFQPWVEAIVQGVYNTYWIDESKKT